MSGQLKYRLGEVLGLEDECGVIDRAELDGLVEETLDPARLVEIEVHARRCAACAELLDDVRQFRTLTASVDTAGLDSMREEGPQSASRFRSPRRARRRWWIPLAAAAAAVTAAVILALWPGANAAPVFAVDPAEAVWIDPPAIRSARSSGLALATAREDFEAGAFERAESTLGAALERSPLDVFVLHALGIVQLRLGDASSAVDALSRADQLQAVAPSQETRFWLAVSLSAAGRPALACDAMRSAAELPGSRRDQARALVAKGCPEKVPAP